MSQIHLRIDGELDQALRAFASTRDISVNAAIRILLYDALFGPPDRTQPEEISR